MSETLEERIRRHAVENRDNLIGFYATDIVELLDKRDADYARLVQAARDVVLNMPEFLIDEAREICGNTNASIVLNYRNALAAALPEHAETE